MPNTPAPTARRRRVQSAETGMGILKALARLGGAASLTALAQAVDESTAKVHRYLASMLEEGLVVQDEASQRYVLGPEAIHIGLAALRQCDPIRAGEPALLRLQAELGVTCFIAVMGNQGPTILRIEEPPLPVVVNVRAGSVLPLLWSATGQAFLAWLEGEAIDQQARADWAAADAARRAALLLPAAGADAPIDTLRQRVRAQGCTTVHDLLVAGISAVAAPIRQHDGHVVAVLTALGASGGFDPAPDGRIAGRVVWEAGEISRALGWVEGGG
jgi:DNA-binding IclR family transcriptional regulator